MIIKSRIMFIQMIKQIRRDMICVLLLFVPFIAGAAIHFAIPFGEEILCRYLGKSQILSPYYFLFDWMISLLPGMMYLFTGGLIILGELDDKIAGYMSVTPAGNNGYLFSRLGFPAIISFFINALVLELFSLTHLSLPDIFIMSLSSALLGVITALLVIAVSSNKVEGMAIGKISGLVGIGMFIPVMFHGKAQYLAAFLPSFWTGKYLLGKNPFCLFGFAVTFILWMVSLLRMYGLKKV